MALGIDLTTDEMIALQAAHIPGECSAFLAYSLPLAAAHLDLHPDLLAYFRRSDQAVVRAAVLFNPAVADDERTSRLGEDGAAKLALPVEHLTQRIRTARSARRPRTSG